MLSADRGRPASAEGKRMVEAFTIKNFRAFSDVRVTGCKQINVLVGDNGSGKTALLEALFLAAGVSPELALRTRSWRGFEDGQLSGSHEDVHQALWGDIFHKFQTSHGAVVTLKGAAEENRSVTVKLNPRGKRRAEPPSRFRPGSPVKTVPVENPIEFKWKIQGLPDVVVTPVFEDGRLKFSPVPYSYVRASFFAANRTSSGLETAGRFSSLSKSLHIVEFAERFSQLYPNIRDLSIELSAGVPMLFARVGNLPQKLPLSLASGGMTKLAAILLAITEQRGGIILIDEIENGFYFKRLPAVWDALLLFARQYECQAFVSTHSSECLDAVARLAEANSEDFCMFRTVSGADGDSKIRQFEGTQFANAVLSDIEVR